MVVHKVNRGEILATLSFEDFLTLYEKGYGDVKQEEPIKKEKVSSPTKG